MTLLHYSSYYLAECNHNSTPYLCTSTLYIATSNIFRSKGRPTLHIRNNNSFKVLGSFYTRFKNIRGHATPIEILFPKIFFWLHNSFLHNSVNKPQHLVNGCWVAAPAAHTVVVGAFFQPQRCLQLLHNDQKPKNTLIGWWVIKIKHSQRKTPSKPYYITLPLQITNLRTGWSVFFPW